MKAHPWDFEKRLLALHTHTHTSSEGAELDLCWYVSFHRITLVFEHMPIMNKIFMYSMCVPLR